MSTLRRAPGYSLILPLITVLIIGGISYHYRHTIAGWFKRTDDQSSQTVVLRQAVTPTPTATPTTVAVVSPTPTPAGVGSIATVTPTPTPSAAASQSLPTAGPEDSWILALIFGAAVFLNYRRRQIDKAARQPAKLDIL